MGALGLGETILTFKPRIQITVCTIRTETSLLKEANDIFSTPTVLHVHIKMLYTLLLKKTKAPITCKKTQTPSHVHQAKMSTSRCSKMQPE